jgi:hypothetical protein
MANTTNYNWETPDDTDLVKDGAAAIRTLGSSVDTTTKALNPSTTLGDIEYRSATANTNTRLPIGTTGQVLSVVGGVPAWATSDDANAIQNAIVDAKGDLISATAADTPARLAVGANGTVLTADSAEATGLKWATPAGGGAGLTLISTTNIGSTAVSSITVSSAFSSTYENYLITINGGVASTNNSLALQLGSTTTGYYGFGFYGNASSSSLAGDNYNNSTSFPFAVMGDTNNLSGEIHIQNPNLAKATAIIVFGTRTGTNGMSNLFGSETSTTQHTAFTLTTSTGTVTGGTIRVYGYSNS